MTTLYRTPPFVPPSTSAGGNPVQLVYTNPTTITLFPYGGNKLLINGESCTIPNAGDACVVGSNLITSTGADAGVAPAASTDYSVYRSNSLASTWPNQVRLSATAPTMVDGVLLLGNSGNALNWIYVGSVRTNSVPNFYIARITSKFNPYVPDYVKTLAPPTRLRSALNAPKGASVGAGKFMTSSWTGYAATELNEWSSVCWSPKLGLFVAVANTGTNRVMTSPDGSTWTARTAAANNQWYSVCWSSELNIFVAVAGNGTNRVMTSSDGITWVAQTPPLEAWYSVCWSPELSLFVAVANVIGTNQVMTSPNGVTWTAQTSPSNTWIAVCWSPELSLFASVASDGNVMTSPDGINWTLRTSPALNVWISICWSPELSLFVAVAFSGTNQVMTSPDGITWTARLCEISSWYSVCWSPELSLFVAVAYAGTNRVMTSPDGITWTAETAASAIGWHSICWAPELSLFVATAIDGTNRVMNSRRYPAH